MKGIVLAGGSGTRLAPLTWTVCKQLLPVYDKPMLYYPICTLMQAGVREICVISTPTDLPIMKRVLRSGEQWGLRFEFREQAEPKGIAQALLIAEDFIGNQSEALILGDNLFLSPVMEEILSNPRTSQTGLTMFAHERGDPKQHGIFEFDSAGTLTTLREKPGVAKAPWAATGLYLYDSNAVQIAKSITPSSRGELEITDVNLRYMASGRLKALRLPAGAVWYDAGTPDSLKSAADYVKSFQDNSGSYIGCPEEIAFAAGWIGSSELEIARRSMSKSPYGEHLERLLKWGPRKVPVGGTNLELFS